MKNSKAVWIWIVAAIGAIIFSSAWVYWLSIRNNFSDYSGSDGVWEIFLGIPIFMLGGATLGVLVAMFGAVVVSIVNERK